MKLRAIGTAIPRRRVGSDTIAQWSGLSEKTIREKIGIDSRAYLSPGEAPVQLATAACENLLRANPALDRSRIKAVIVVTQNPDYKLPHSSALLQHALGLASDTACFDINLGCSGYVYGLTAAKGFMLAEDIHDALLVTCDPYSRIMGKSDRDTVALFGDAATATWLSADRGAEIGKLDFGTDGAGAENLIVRAGGSAHPLSAIDYTLQPDGEPEGLRLRMNGRGIFNFMIERVPGSIDNALRRNALTKDEVDYFVFHQASRFLLEQLASRLGLPADKVPSNLANLGNTVSSSIPLLLAELLAAGKLSGKTVLVSGFGVGLSWATNVIRF